MSDLWRRIVARFRRELAEIFSWCASPGSLSEPPERCPLNVPGPFYTTGQCMACEAPEIEAPDLLAPLNVDNYTTHFIRQPETPEEVTRACNAIRVCCVNDLRYGGTDPEIIRRLGNDSGTCDHIIRGGRAIPAWITQA